MFRFPSANRNKRFLFSFDKLNKRIRLIVFSLLLVSRASSYELGNWAGSVTGTNVVVCSLGKFPGRPGCSSRNKTKMMKHKLVSFGTIVRLCRLFQLTTTSAVEKHTRQKLCHFCRYVAIAKLFCQKMFLPGHQGWSVHMEKFSSPIFR